MCPPHLPVRPSGWPETQLYPIVMRDPRAYPIFKYPPTLVARDRLLCLASPMLEVLGGTVHLNPWTENNMACVVPSREMQQDLGQRPFKIGRAHV